MNGYDAISQTPFKPAAEKLLEIKSPCWDKKKEPKDIGKKPGGQEKYPADKDKEPIQKFGSRDPAACQFVLDTAHDAEPLPTDQPRAGKADRKEQ